MLRFQTLTFHRRKHTILTQVIRTKPLKAF